MRAWPGRDEGSWQYAFPIFDRPSIKSRSLRPLAGLVPVALSVAWLPLRAHLPNTDLALMLVVVVAGAGFLGGRPAVLLGAVGSGLTFDLLHTTPYGQLAIHSGRDVLTTTFLVVASLLMGEVTVRLGGYRRRAEAEADAFALVTHAAGLIAMGSEVGLVLEALISELTSGLSLVECTFEIGPPSGEAPFVGRDGTIVRLDDSASPEVEGPLDLPVWSSGEIVGHFRMVRSPDTVLEVPQLQLAIGIADQAGAAMLAHIPPAGKPPRRGLRLVKG